MTNAEERIAALEARIVELEGQLARERTWRARWWRGALLLAAKLALSVLVAYLTAQGCAPHPRIPRASPPPVPAPRDSQGDTPP